MTTLELAREVRAMRDAQKAYFAARRKKLPGSAELEASKAAENRVDAMVKGLIEDYPALLPGFGE